MKIKKSVGLRAFHCANIIYLTLISLCMVVPFLLVLSTSFTSEVAVRRTGYTIWPGEFSLDAYDYVLRGGAIFNAYRTSIIVTLAGTLIAVLITAMAGYALSRQNLRYRNGIALAFYFTMLFNGGIVPWYIIVSRLGIRNTLWALILPMCFSPFNMLLIRNFFQTLPSAVIESAKLDGAGEMTIFTRVVIPISLPGLATITLFYMLAYWNDWWLALNFIDKEDMFPLQYLLRKVLSHALYASSGMAQSTTTGTVPTETVKAATSIITIGPIVLVYPFIQKYFIKGITVGAVKG